MSEKKFKILHLPAWYPNRNSSFSGIFIQKHISSTNSFCDNAVLYIAPDEKMAGDIFFMDKKTEEDIFTVRIYYKKVTLGIPVLSHLLKIYRNLICMRLGMKEIKRYFGLPDIIHVHVLDGLKVIPLYYKLLKGIPYIISEHWSGYLKADESYPQFWLKITTKTGARFASAITTVSTALKNAMLSCGLKGNYFIIPNIVEAGNTENFSVTKSGKIKILVVADLIERIKNLSGIMEAFGKICTPEGNSELHFIGDGKDRKKLEEMAAKLHLLNKHIFFHGELPNEKVFEMMRHSSFLVNFSNYETFSVSTAEAIANGIPVIATKEGGIADYVNEENGVLVEPGNLQQLEDAMRWMLRHHKNFDSKKISEKMLNKFNRQTIGKKFAEVYNDAISL